MNAPTCELCMATVRTGETQCALCRRFNRYERPLEGGSWVRDGLIMRWVQDGAA